MEIDLFRYYKIRIDNVLVNGEVQHKSYSMTKSILIFFFNENEVIKNKFKKKKKKKRG